VETCQSIHLVLSANPRPPRRESSGRRRRRWKRGGFSPPTITVIATGSLDATLAADSGVIATTDGASGGTQAETLSAGALEAVGATTNINISASTGISFNDQGVRLRC